MLDETKNIYVDNNIIVRLTPDEMIIMRLLIEKLKTNSYLPMSEIERRINRVQKRMIDRIIKGLRYKLQKTSIEINCTRGLGYYIEKKEEDFEKKYIRKDKIREVIKDYYERKSIPDLVISRIEELLEGE